MNNSYYLQMRLLEMASYQDLTWQQFCEDFYLTLISIQKNLLTVANYLRWGDLTEGIFYVTFIDILNIYLKTLAS